MIELAKGNLLQAPVEALVNTVNTEGVMGKGIALQFKQAYPLMFRAYQHACEANKVRLGEVHVHDLGSLVGGPRWIINFPTKGHWRSKSKLSDIESGLQSLVSVIERLGISSIAVPPLGCGHGGLSWGEVRPLINHALGSLPNLRVLVFAPGESPLASSMPNRTERPKMTVGQAALITLMDRYLQGLLDPFISLLEVHKLMYFLQAAGQPLRLNYEKAQYGPYAMNLRQVLIRLESHYTQGYGDGSDEPTKPLELLPGAVKEAQVFLAQDQVMRERMDRVVDLINGYEDPTGLELLSSVHWVTAQAPKDQQGPEAALRAIQDWNARKQRLLKPEHVAKAWEHLNNKGWIAHASNNVIHVPA